MIRETYHTGQAARSLKADTFSLISAGRIRELGFHCSIRDELGTRTKHLNTKNRDGKIAKFIHGLKQFKSTSRRLLEELSCLQLSKERHIENNLKDGGRQDVKIRLVKGSERNLN